MGALPLVETEGRSYAGYRAVGFDYEEVKRDERAIQRPHDEEEDDEEDDDEMEPYQVPHGFLIPDHTQLVHKYFPGDTY